MSCCIKTHKLRCVFPNGKIFADKAWLVIIGNAASYAWNIKVTDHAHLDDGLIVACLLPCENKLFSVQQLVIMMGPHVERGTAHYWKVRAVRVESKPPVPIQLGGEEWSYSPVEIGVLPGALSVLAPEYKYFSQQKSGASFSMRRFIVTALAYILGNSCYFPNSSSFIFASNYLSVLVVATS